MQKGEYTQETCLVEVEAKNSLMGIIVDITSEVTDIVKQIVTNVLTNLRITALTIAKRIHTQLRLTSFSP